MVWIFDASALHAIPDLCGGAARCGPFLQGLGEQIAAHELYYCRETVNELKILASGELHCVWAEQAFHGMGPVTSTWQDLQHAVVQLEDDIDFGVQVGEVELPYVAALALVLAEDNDVTVVTEDDVDKPDVIAMTTACSILEIESLSLTDFGSATGFDCHFAD